MNKAPTHFHIGQFGPRTFRAATDCSPYVCIEAPTREEAIAKINAAIVFYKNATVALERDAKPGFQEILPVEVAA